MNAELQRTARRGKKAFLSEHCKEIEKNKRMEKTSNLFKKTGRYQGNIAISSRKLGDIKGIFHSKMGTIKDRTGR